MGDQFVAGKLPLAESILKDIAGLSILQDWMEQYLQVDGKIDSSFRANLMSYEVGDMQSCCL